MLKEGVKPGTPPRLHPWKHGSERVENKSILNFIAAHLIYYIIFQTDNVGNKEVKVLRT